ncbi:MAG: FtsX-like permease family protein [bacterium]|nr:FtsX-like permease family protein [bacterium]
MKTLEKSVAYISRKKKRTAIIFVILSVMLTSLYACLNILKSSAELEKTLYQISNSSFSIVRKDGQENFKFEDIKSVKSVKEIKEFLPEYQALAQASGKKAVENGEQQVQREDLGEALKNTLAVQAVRNSSKNTLFSSGVFKLKKGAHLEANGAKVLIHEAFANKNNLHVGDKISFEFVDSNGKKNSKTEFEIAGIFEGKKQEKYTGLSADLSENTVFADFETSQRALGNANDKALLNKISLHAETPEKLDLAMKKVEKLKIDWSKYKIEKNTAAFENTLESIGGIRKIINLTAGLIVVGGGVVLILILILWLRERVYEIGILLAIGTRKIVIAVQFILELVLVSIPAAAISLIAGNLLLGAISKGLSGGEETANVAPNLASGGFEMSNLATFAQSYGILLAVMILAVILSSAMILTKKPKEILSKIS